MEKVYYTLTGKTAIGVFDSYALTKEKQQYAPKSEIRKFYDLEEAMEYALTKALELFPFGCDTPDELKLNWLEYAKDHMDA